MNSRDGIIGFAIGDAMGVPVEFMAREKLLQNPVTTMLERGTHDQAKGTWSDDTSMTLATMDSIINCFGISTVDMGNRFLEWLENGKYTTNGKRFDVGRTTLVSLARFEKTGQPFESGASSEDSNGNGSLMRMLPIAYYCFSSNMKPEDVFDIVKKVSCITHAHEVSILGCYIYVLYAMKLLENKSKYEAYREIQNINYSKFSRSAVSLYNRILKKGINTLELEDIRSTGYIVDTLEAVFWTFLNTDNFNQAIIGAINLGDDTDTIGACTGGLAGIVYGLKSINPEWRIDLKKYTYIRIMCDKFDTVLRSSNKKFEKDDLVYGNEEKIVKIIQGDITKLNVDAYVNSANNSLIGGDGVDGAIHNAAGYDLMQKCKELNGCDTGEAKITRGYNSKAKFIIHTVAPKWYEAQMGDKQKILRKCYDNSILLAKDFECKRIAFPCLGVGVYGCPIDISAKIAINFAISEARKKDSEIETIYLVCYRKEEYEYYMKYFKEKINEK